MSPADVWQKAIVTTAKPALTLADIQEEIALAEEDIENNVIIASYHYAVYKHYPQLKLYSTNAELYLLSCINGFTSMNVEYGRTNKETINYTVTFSVAELLAFWKRTLREYKIDSLLDESYTT